MSAPLDRPDIDIPVGSIDRRGSAGGCCALTANTTRRAIFCLSMPWCDVLFTYFEVMEFPRFWRVTINRVSCTLLPGPVCAAGVYGGEGRGGERVYTPSMPYPQRANNVNLPPATTPYPPKKGTW